MEQLLKKHLAPSAALLCLVHVLSPTNVSEAIAEEGREEPRPVLVVNPPTKPVPTVVQNIPSITGSVSVINTPSVNVVNTPSVNLLPGTVVALAAGSNVGVSGTVGLAPGTTVGISGTPTVHVDNPGPGAGTPFLLTGSFTSSIATFGLGLFSTDSVPAGKLFVIDSVNCIVKTSPSGGKVITQVQTALPGGHEAVTWLPAPAPTPVLGTDFNVINQVVRTFAAASSQVGFGFQFDSSLTADVSCTAAGMLVDQP